jgi:8-oxo-dGTP diphosphatase
MTRRELHVTAAIIVRDGALLAAQRRPGAQQGGLWELPGGKQEPGETLERCLARELDEELAVSVSVGPRLTTSVHDYPSFRVHLHAFRCAIARGTPIPRVHQALRWLAAAELLSVPWAPADLPLVEQILRDGLLERAEMGSS